MKTMKSSRVFTNIICSSGYYIWLLFLCSVIISLFDLRIGLPVFIVTTVCFILNLTNGLLRRKEVKKFINILTDNNRKKFSSILGGNLFPTVIVNHDGTIVWSNKGFSDIVSTKVINKTHIKELIPEFELYECLNVSENEYYKLIHNNRIYMIEMCSTNQLNEKYYALHFNDCTDYESLMRKYSDEKFVSAVIFVDNYDDVMSDVPNADKPKISAAIEETLNLCAQDINGIIKKYEKDKFVFYFANKGLQTFLDNKFDILERIKSISLGNRFSPTLSIGVGCDGESMMQNEIFAYNALDMALGRGGDQAIVKNSDKYLFFGGKTQETEKRTKVKARVVAEAIKQLLKDNDNVLIMGHRNSDCDSFGAAIGLYKAITSYGKNCKIVMETYNSTVAKMLTQFNDELYEDAIINKAYANEVVNANTVVFVVDTHVSSMVEEPSLLEVSKQIVVIDHHRRNADYINNPILSYHEPYASSASEIVTEIIQYMGEQVKLGRKESEALYAGIYMDTKQFTFKTGVRTFEAASYLRRFGADTVEIKKLFQIDINTFTKKWAIMEMATTYKHSISIVKCTKNDPDMQTIIAQVADEMLNLSDISCSFVICDMGNSISISARSLGDINIQIITEKLGGGGHLTMAATQINDVTLDEAEEMLKAAIDEYLSNN